MGELIKVRARLAGKEMRVTLGDVKNVYKAARAVVSTMWPETMKHHKNKLQLKVVR